MPKQSSLPAVELPLTRRQANKLRWISFVLGATSIVASGIVAMAFIPGWLTQLCGGAAGICTGLSYHFARQTPSSVVPAARKPYCGPTPIPPPPEDR